MQILHAKHANKNGAFLSIRETRRPRIDPHFNFLYAKRMAKKAAAKGRTDLPVSQDAQQRVPTTRRKPSSLLDTRVIYCGDNLEQLAKLPDACVDLIYIDPPKPMQKE